MKYDIKKQFQQSIISDVNENKGKAGESGSNDSRMRAGYQEEKT